MSFGAETNTRWLWFLTYVLLPLNVIGQVCVLFWFVDNGQGGMALVLILAELCLAIVTIVGLHQQKPWGWYCIMAMFGIQLVGTPLKVQVRASMKHEVNRTLNIYLESEGRPPLNTVAPSIFDFEPMLTSFLVLVVWTIPNTIYMYRRRNVFGVAASSSSVPEWDSSICSQMVSAATLNGVVAEEDEAYYTRAAAEVESGNPHQGLWIASTLDLTDPSQQRAAYIRNRVAQMKHEVIVLRPQRIRNARRKAVRVWWRDKIATTPVHDIGLIIVLVLLWPIGIIVAPILLINALLVYWSAEK